MFGAESSCVFTEQPHYWPVCDELAQLGPLSSLAAHFQSWVILHGKIQFLVDSGFAADISGEVGTAADPAKHCDRAGTL